MKGLGSKIVVYKIRVWRYANKMYTGRIWNIEKRERVYHGKEVNYVLKASFSDETYTNINPVSYAMDFEIRVDLNKIDVDENEAKKRIREFVETLVEKYKEGDVCVNELYKDLLDLCTLLCTPYTTIGHEASIFDTGGDYPRARLVLKYYA